MVHLILQYCQMQATKLATFSGNLFTKSYQLNMTTKTVIAGDWVCMVKTCENKPILTQRSTRHNKTHTPMLQKCLFPKLYFMIQLQYQVRSHALTNTEQKVHGLLYGQKREPIQGQIMLKTDVTGITVCCEHCGMKPDFSIHNLNMQIN